MTDYNARVFENNDESFYKIPVAFMHRRFSGDNWGNTENPSLEHRQMVPDMRTRNICS